MRPNLLHLVVLGAFAPASLTHAADVNGYTAQYECRAGGAYCNVDVVALGQRACDQVVSSSTPWSSINWSNNTICIEAGDHTHKGTLEIPSWANGAAGNYKVLRYTRSSDTDDDPWQQTSQARLWQLRVSGDYWLIHRLTFPGVSGTNPSPRVETAARSNDVTNIIFNRILVEGVGQGSSYYGLSQNCNSGRYDRITIQNSVFRNVGPYARVYEGVALDMQCASNMHAVNNEIYDWVSHPIQIGQNNIPTLTGVVVENNDLYVSPALYTEGGTRAIAESPLSVKVKGTASSPVRIVHNRIWGARPTDLNYCCNGESGYGITMYDSNDYVLLQNNIITDSQIGVSNVADRNSYIGNLFFNIRRFNSGVGSLVFDSWYSHDGAAGYEAYLNTIVSAEQYTFGGLDHSDVDVRCNVMLASGPKYPASPSSSSQADHNAFYGTPSWSFNGTNTAISRPLKTRANNVRYDVGDIVSVGPLKSCGRSSDASCFLYKVTSAGTSADGSVPYCTSLGCTVSDGSVTLQAIRGPYAFYRKLRTGPEPYVVPYARVHASAPEAYACPADFAARRGIGINDDL